MTDLQIPVLTTEHLILREPRESDIDAVAAFYASDRSRYVGGPCERIWAWRWLLLGIGHWVLKGYGYWTVEERATGGIVGRVGVVNHDGWPEPELGWHIYEGFEGRGYAFEAATAARDHVQGHMGLGPLCSLIEPTNERSKALATRLGASFERVHEHVNGERDELWRHPATELTDGGMEAYA